MNTLSQQTRNQSHASLGTNYLNKTQKVILESVRKYGASTTNDLASRLPYTRSSIVARVSELREKFLLREGGKKYDPITEREVTKYCTYTSPEARRSDIDNAYGNHCLERDEIVRDLNSINSRIGAKLLRANLIKIEKRIKQLAEL